MDMPPFSPLMPKGQSVKSGILKKANKNQPKSKSPKKLWKQVSLENANFSGPEAMAARDAHSV